MLLLLYFSFPFQIDIVWGSFLIPGTVLGSHTVAMETGVVSAPSQGSLFTVRPHGHMEWWHVVSFPGETKQELRTRQKKKADLYHI